MMNPLSSPTAFSYSAVSGVRLFGILAAIALGAFCYSLSRRFRVIALGKTERCSDRFFTRIWRTVCYAFLQLRMFKDPYAGVMHFLIFSGFSILLVQNAVLILRGFVPNLDLSRSEMGRVYDIAADVFQVLVLVGLAMAIYRRAFVRPKRLESSFDAWLILFLIGLLMVTNLVADASRIALNPSQRGWWSPAAGMLSLTFTGLSVSSVTRIFTLCWWVHLIDIFIFANYLPYSKHFHIIIAIPNIFAQKLSPMGQLRGIDLNNAESFGASKVEHFTWKALLDGYACTECGRCGEVCPTALTGKPLDPKKFIQAFRGAITADAPRLLAEATARRKGENGQQIPLKAGKPLIGGWISEETIWACTTCGYCTSACPVFIIPVVDKIVELRRHLVLERAEFPNEMKAAFRGMESNGNPWGMPAVSRAEWAAGLPVVTMAQAAENNIEYLFWVGCAGSYDDRAKRVSVALAEILDQAGVKFAILGAEEACTGDAARRMGNEYLFQALARQNVNTLNGYGVKKIVTNCPHCLNCLKNEYPEFGGNYEVLHGTELVAKLVAEGRVVFNRAISDSVTFHDPCYLGRYNNVYDAPRQILSAIPNLEIREVAHSRSQGLCCGAGGGRMWMEERLGDRINRMRMAEIADTGAEKLAVACPFCHVMLTSAKADLDARPPVFDVLELARASIAPQSQPPARPLRKSA